MFKRLTFVFSVLWLAACSSLPEEIKLSEADQAKLVTYPQVAAKPDDTKGKLAQWGGVIAKLDNLEDSTLIELLYYPMSGSGRPQVSDDSIGRFRVYVDGFLDPLVFTKGRSMSFSGDVSGIEDGKVGEHKYRFPTLHAKGYYLWSKIKPVDISDVHVWPYYYWQPWYHRPVYVVRPRAPRPPAPKN